MVGSDTEVARGGFSLINLKNTLISKIGGIFGNEELAKKVEPQQKLEVEPKPQEESKPPLYLC
jgi:hypothetical protein